MKKPGHEANKALYAELRRLSCERLWNEEVKRFDRATPAERVARVSVVRAVGVVFSESGSEEQKAMARSWLRELLQDSNEKVRRYAMAALPKLGAGVEDERKLLTLLRATAVDRERKYLGRTLEKIGGTATLEMGADGTIQLQTEQKVRASLARSTAPGTVTLGCVLNDFAELRIHLRCRRGLEQFVRAEVEEAPGMRGKFRVAEVRSGLVVLHPGGPFSLDDIYAFRCFGSMGFLLGRVRDSRSVEDLAAVIVSPLSQRILKTLTQGAPRYRLDFVEKGHQRAVVRMLANRAYALCPEILNDARSAPWVIAIRPDGRGSLVELYPRLRPDPRFSYRQQDVPAASHPPLAACMARLAGSMENEIVWDPFCGSGLELVECALRGGVARLHGSDRSAEALGIAAKNLAAAPAQSCEASFTCCDFRDFARIEGLGPASATLIITNPPMGRRVPIPNLRGLITDLLFVAAKVLRPGGRLVFANPLRLDSPERSLKLQFREIVDLGGFDCRLEKYVKLPA